MHATRHAVLVVSAQAILFTSLACAAQQATRSGVRPASSRDARVSAAWNALTAHELRQANGSNAFDVVERLRPLFLRTRGLHAPTVFVDHIRRGGVHELRLIPATSIAEIRYFDGRTATQRFGTGYTGGVIYLLTGGTR
jgi:hypothetical protein